MADDMEERLNDLDGTDSDPVEDKAIESDTDSLENEESENAKLEVEQAVKTEEPAKEVAVKEPENKMDWYILKVQVNREDTIKEHLKRRIQLSGLDKYFEELLVPTEKVTVVKNGQKKVTKRKLYPGYLMVRMEINDDTWFLVRETSGVGDFTGAGGKPVAMLPHEVQRMLQSETTSETDEAPKVKIPYEIGDRVKIVDGTFKDVEGEVDSIDDITGRVTVNITIFGRSTPVELEYWQAEKSED